MSKYTLRASGNETKPFKTYEEAVKFGQAWLGKFSIFSEILLYKDGEFMEKIQHAWAGSVRAEPL